MASSSLSHHHETIPSDISGYFLSTVSEGPEVSLCQEDAPDDASVQNVRRCSSLIRDTNANLYQRGLAVMVLGKILGRETEEARSRGAVHSGILSQYLASKSGAGRDVLDALLDIVGACTPSKSGKIKAVSEGCGEADARKIRSNCSVLISLLMAMIAGGIEATPGVDAHSLRKNCGGSRKKVPFLPAVSSSSELFIQMKPRPSPDVIQDSPKKGWAARKELPQPMNDSPRSPSRARGVHKRSSATRTPSKKRPLTSCLATSSHGTSRADRTSRLPQNAATGEGQTVLGEPPLLACASPFTGPDKQGVDVQAEHGTDGAGPGSGSEMAPALSQSPPRSPARNTGLFASPPRLGSERRSRGPSLGYRRGGRRRHLALSDAPERDSPLGLSSSGLGRSRSTKKVWHNVGMSARKASAGGTTAGSAPFITLSVTERSERFGRQPPVRPAVLFGSDLPRERKLRGDCDERDVVAADARLGYQIPRLWIAHAHPETTGGHQEGWVSASMGVSMPQMRHLAVEGAKRPVASDAVVQEYQQMQAFRTYRALAQSRPASVEPLHGPAANYKIVELLGKRPETEDGVIARDWSPRGGRKQRRGRSAREAPVAPEGDGDGGAPARSTSPSRSPPCQNAHVSNAQRAVQTSWMSRSPQGVDRRFMSRMNPRPRVSPPSAMPSRCERPVDLRVTESSSWSSRDPTHDGIDSPEGFSIHPGVTPIRAPSETSPQYPACSAGGVVGNLGGWYASPCSPYRTYRAKHARLARAHSSERAEASKRRRTARGGNIEGWERRCSSADEAERRRVGTSGMTSPLLRREGFGLLESDVTNKISLGFQLPFDRPSPAGRARAAATTAVSAAHAHALELFSGINSTLPPSDVRRPRRCELGRHPCPEASPLRRLSWTQDSAGEESRGRGAQLLPLRVSRDGEGRPTLDPLKRPKRSTSVGGRSVREMPYYEDEIARGSRYSRISWSPQRTGIWNKDSPKIPTSNICTGEAGRWEGSSNGGSSGDDDQGFPVGVDHSQRRYQSWVGGDGESVAPRRSRWSRCTTRRHPEGVTGASRGHRSPSPLDSPLGRYHASRTVMRAGTLASRSDVAEVERASSRAMSALRGVSRARRQIAKRSRRTSLADDNRCRGGNRRFTDYPDFGQHSSETSGEELSGDEAMLTRIRRSLPSLQLMDRELEAIRRADKAMKEEQLAQVKLNINALPLALLLVHPGGGAEGREFVARALELWLRERMRARLTYAMARWKIECEAQRFHERGIGYRQSFGALKFKVREAVKRVRCFGKFPFSPNVMPQRSSSTKRFSGSSASSICAVRRSSAAYVVVPA